jgi:hypothetical protein
MNNQNLSEQNEVDKNRNEKSTQKYFKSTDGLIRLGIIVCILNYLLID